MKIVPVSQEHLPTIQKISNEVWPKTFKDILSPDQIKYMMEMMYSTGSLEEQMRNNHQYLLAKDDEGYLGFLSYELNYKGKPWTKVHKIYVLTSAQGKGVGRILIDEAAKIGRDNGNKELSLNVNRYNKAIKFYEKMGFEIVDKEDIDIGNGFLMEDYIMNKKL
jgi:ribosomal protein S18 acetylase RimI-like enzyme